MSSKAEKTNIKLIVFLGNPGTQYAKTRHNVGWMCADALPGAGALSWKEKFSGKWCTYGAPGNQVKLLCPQTFMNKSGESVRKAMDFFQLEAENILVVYDDLELPFGTVQYRSEGGLGGHNGLRSIKQHIGSANFYRYKIGIGRPSRGDVSSWVLSQFSVEEEPLLGTLLGRSASLIEGIYSNSDKAPKRDKKWDLLAGMPN